MKKSKTLFGLCTSALLIFTSIVMACSNNYEDVENDFAHMQSANSYPQLQEFLVSDECELVMSRYGITAGSLAITETIQEINDEKGINSYIIPIKKEGTVCGKLYVFVKRGHYNTLFEDWSDAPITQNTGIVKIYTDGKFVATLSIERQERDLKSKILTVAELPEDITRNEDEGWWACTTRVYKTAKAACQSDAQCDFLCDLVNMSGGCTISMAVAAAYVCL